MAKPKKKPDIKKPRPKRKSNRKVIPKVVKGVGAPIKYNPVMHPMIAEALAMAGRVDDEIAQALGVANSTYYRWKNEYPELSDAVARGKNPVDIKVENELLLNCLSREVIEEKQVMEDGKPKRMEKTRKHELGSVRAQQFWLKNRRPDTWRDRTHLDINDERGGIEDLTDDELEKHEQRYREILGEEGAETDTQGKGEAKSKA